MMLSKNGRIIYLLLLILFLILIILNFVDPLLMWDENAYLGNARSHLTVSNFQEDFRFPLLEYIIVLPWFITGENILIAKLIVILIAIGTIFLTYLISKKFFLEKEAILITFLFAICSQIIFWGFRVYTDIPALFFILLSFYFFIKNEENNKKRFIALAGIFAALAFLMKFTSMLLFLAIFLSLTYKKKFKQLVIFILFFILALTPWFIYNYLNYHNILWDLIEQYKIVNTYTSLQPISKQIINLFKTISLLTIFIPIGLFSFFLRIKKYKVSKEILLFVYVIICFIYFFFFVKLKDIRYFLPFLTFLYILAYDGLLYITKNININIRKVILTLIILFAIFSFGLAIVQIAKEGNCSRSGAILQSINYLGDKINQSDKILSNFWPWLGYYLNVRVGSLWNDNLDGLLNDYKPNYILYSINSLSYNKTILDSSTHLELEKKIEDNCGEIVFIYKVK
ncbi:glycosyltransferase family 39 protein [Candidatus Pacearchaeota archaeon]|nr:glycosyltransferase family 39 protein [Candidatus Pacearchaeota archaeon]